MIGKMLRLVGISSPEDSIPKSAETSGLPSDPAALLAYPDFTFNQTRGLFQLTPALFDRHPRPADVKPTPVYVC